MNYFKMLFLILIMSVSAISVQTRNNEVIDNSYKIKQDTIPFNNLHYQCTIYSKYIGNDHYDLIIKIKCIENKNENEEILLNEIADKIPELFVDSNYLVVKLSYYDREKDCYNYSNVYFQNNGHFFEIKREQIK